MKNIPNILSVIRILLVGVFIYALFFVNTYVALLIFFLAGATDVIDGYLARRNNWITNLGKILDPVADKLMQCTVLVGLYIKGLIPLWFVIPYFVKELFTLTVGAVVLRRRSVVVVSKWYGKATVCLFYATIALSVLIADVLEGNMVLTIIVFTPAVVCSIAALVAYIKHYIGLKDKTSIQTEKENSEKKADAADAVENN